MVAVEVNNMQAYDWFQSSSYNMHNPSDFHHKLRMGMRFCTLYDDTNSIAVEIERKQQEGGERSDIGKTGKE